MIVGGPPGERDLVARFKRKMDDSPDATSGDKEFYRSRSKDLHESATEYVRNFLF